MRQLTVRGLDGELVQHIKLLAEHEHLSLNQAALKLMRRGAGLDRADLAGDIPVVHVGHTCWTVAETEELERITARQGKIDSSDWEIATTNSQEIPLVPQHSLNCRCRKSGSSRHH